MSLSDLNCFEQSFRSRSSPDCGIKSALGAPQPTSLLTLALRNRALLTSELQAIFAQAPLAPNSIAHARIRDAYARATGKITATASSSNVEPANEKKRIPGPDDDCPICYESMHGTSETSLTWCDECGNALHKECFDQCTFFRLT